MKKNIRVGENEHLILPLFWDGQEKEISYQINLAERGAQLVLWGLLLGKNEDGLELRINIYHSAPETKSKVVLKGVLTGSSKINFEGLVKIEKGSKGANAWLGSHFLLLSEKAKGRAIPSLEILENDIKAGHAATVGKVNDLELFYLMSRGLTKDQAKKIIVEGFLKSILEKLPENITHHSKSLKEYS